MSRHCDPRFRPATDCPSQRRGPGSSRNCGLAVLVERRPRRGVRLVLHLTSSCGVPPLYSASTPAAIGSATPCGGARPTVLLGLWKNLYTPRGRSTSRSALGSHPPGVNRTNPGKGVANRGGPIAVCLLRSAFDTCRLVSYGIRSPCSMSARLCHSSAGWRNCERTALSSCWRAATRAPKPPTSPGRGS